MAVFGLKLCEGTFRGDEAGQNPNDRAKLGVKTYILTDQRGTPISTVISWQTFMT
jgi:hypothetical protein